MRRLCKLAVQAQAEQDSGVQSAFVGCSLDSLARIWIDRQRCVHVATRDWLQAVML